MVDEFIEKAELELAQSIKNLLSKNQDNVVELDIRTFYNLWFRGRKVDLNVLTDKMLRFSETYGLDYVIIVDKKSRLGGVGRYLAVRLWDVEEFNRLLEEKENAVCDTGEETSSE